MAPEISHRARRGGVLGRFVTTPIWDDDPMTSRLEPDVFEAARP